VEHSWERLTVSDAAKLLNVTPEAVRQRIRRGTIEHERTQDGRYYVFLSPKEDVEDHVENGTNPDQQLRSDYIETLKRELEARNQELSEMRRLVAGALERIPAIEAPAETPSEAPRSPSIDLQDDTGIRTSAEQEKPSESRSWWRWFFGT
jgi:excisionase family DNA binding protein